MYVSHNMVAYIINACRTIVGNFLLQNRSLYLCGLPKITKLCTYTYVLCDVFGCYDTLGNQHMFGKHLKMTNYSADIMLVIMV